MAKWYWLMRMEIGGERMIWKAIKAITAVCCWMTAYYYANKRDTARTIYFSMMAVAINIAL